MTLPYIPRTTNYLQKINVLRISSFNCTIEIRDPCEACDVILLQKKWLTELELTLLSQMVDQKMCTEKSEIHFILVWYLATNEIPRMQLS